MTAPCPAWFALPLLLLLAGCATTPAQRIEQNQKLFDALPVDAQARIRGGQIELGFTSDMVRIALGEPQRKLFRRAPEGCTEIWFYLDILRTYERQHAQIDGLAVYAGSGGARPAGGSAWINILQEKEVLRTRVEFKDNLVVAIEQQTKDESNP